MEGAEGAAGARGSDSLQTAAGAENAEGAAHAENVRSSDSADSAENARSAEGVEGPENLQSAQSVDGSENLQTAESAAGGESVANPQGGTENPAGPERKRPRSSRLAALVGTVLLLGAVVAGAGYTVVTVQGADRDPGRPTWKFPKPSAAGAKAEKAASGLRGLLLPYGENGYTRGPDLGEFGADAELSGRQATALRKESLKDLPRTQRRQLEKEIDKQSVKGMAMRSYVYATRRAINFDEAFSVSVALARMESREAARDIATSQNEFFSDLGVFRKGPKIEGHKNAKCFLTPKGEDEKLDGVFCAAYSGDVLISFTAAGVRPVDLAGIGVFVTRQLDRIDDPGKAV
ncbi:hypothetical protein [Streptomyces muensis]|uniref:Secreted protein n=1 Tax=Streptomyces muensis TaxID=1077944 RepID=A0A9X1Q7A6_STRM4|nr:hypothetical protein [Streptomyces muensis]MCF1599240.1 hypothetical protein [Streptomyces muensis]